MYLFLVLHLQLIIAWNLWPIVISFSSSSPTTSTPPLALFPLSLQPTLTFLFPLWVSSSLCLVLNILLVYLFIVFVYIQEEWLICSLVKRRILKQFLNTSFLLWFFRWFIWNSWFLYLQLISELSISSDNYIFWHTAKNCKEL